MDNAIIQEIPKPETTEFSGTNPQRPVYALFLAGKMMGCGVCVDKCEQGALALVRDEAKGIPLEICALMDEAANAGI